MKNRFVISENDRRSILSMYGLLTEEEKEYNFSGVIKDDGGLVIPTPTMSIKKKKSDGSYSVPVIKIETDDKGNFKKIVKLDDTLEYIFYIEKTEFLAFEQKIDLTKTDQTNLELILKKLADVTDLEESVIQVFFLTNFSIEVKDKKNNPINDYNLKIVIDESEVFNKNIFESETNLSFLKNGLLLNDLEKGKFYDTKSTEGEGFNQGKKRNIIKNVKFIISKTDYEEKIINYDLKFNNSSASLNTKITNDNEYVTYEGNEEIKVSEGNENVIDFELSKLPTNVIKNITGQLKVKGPLSNLIDGPKNVTLELYAYKKENENENLYEPTLIQKIVTKENGYFYFNVPETIKLSNFENFEISFDGNDTFGSINKKILVKDIASNPIVIETGDYSVGEIVLNDSENSDENKNEENLPVISSYCKNYKTTKRKIYGLGVSENISNNDALNMAVINAIKSFVQFYPKYEILDYLLINDPKIYRVVCNKVTKQKREVVVRLVPKELKKYAEYKESIEIPSIKFRNLDFTDAINRSFESKTKIFLIFTGNDSNSKDVLKKLNSNLEIINLLNDEYINLNYDVNISNKDKYLIASNSLEVYTYPYVVILEGIGNTETTPNLKDSYRVLKKYGMKNDLMNLNVDSF